MYLIHRRDQLRAAQVLQDALKDFHNITCIWDTTVEKIGGRQQVQWITLKQTKDRRRVSAGCGWSLYCSGNRTGYRVCKKNW